MQRSTRPGGLTALAIVNFVFGGLGLLGLLSGLVMLAFIMSVKNSEEPTPGMEPMLEISLAWYGMSLAVNFIITLLLVISAIGYLKQRAWGRWLGTAYALLRLGWIPVELAYLKEMGAEFGLDTVIGMIYPLMTLVMVHVICRDVWGQGGWIGSFKVDKQAVSGDTTQPAGHIGLVLRQSLWQLARGATGLLFMLCTFILGCLVCSILLFVTHGLDDARVQNRERLAEQGTEVQAPQRVIGPVVEAGMIAWMVNELSWKDFKNNWGQAEQYGSAAPDGMDAASNADDSKPMIFFVHNDDAAMQEFYPWTSSLTDDGAPGALNLCWLVLSRFLLPLIVVLGAFNQIAGDAKNRGLRYVLSRTDRQSLFIGRFLAALVFILLTLALLVATIGIYVYFKLPGMEAGAVCWSSLRGFVALATTAVPYVALCMWLSTLINSSFGALAIGEAIVVIGPIAILVAAQSWEPLAAIAWLLPAGGQHLLLHYNIGLVALMLLACAAYTLIYFFVGRQHFLRRDL